MNDPSPQADNFDGIVIGRYAPVFTTTSRPVPRADDGPEKPCDCGACDVHDHGEHAYVPICFECSKEDTGKARKALAKLRTYIATYAQAGGHINTAFHETLRMLIAEGLGL